MNPALIEKHRDINTDEGWWESTYDSFTEDMALIGIRVDKMYFSGFWSQGDGACFEGCVEDWELFLKTLGHIDPTLIAHAKEAWRFSTNHRSGNYYHAYSTSFDGDLAMPDGYSDDLFICYYSPYPEDDFRSQAWLAIITQYANTDFEEEFTNTFRDHMNALYKRLGEEYDYLTSDEVVWESIVANELDKVTTEENEE
jgi:hypothetical protein